MPLEEDKSVSRIADEDVDGVSEAVKKRVSSLAISLREDR